MARKIIYQTLQDWDNAPMVRQEAPFICTSEDAWLGNGYYFWDTFEKIAHWWGKSQHNDQYIICRGECDFKRQYCLDLHGEPEDMALFMSIADVMESEGLLDDKTTVCEVLMYMYYLGIFDYQAVRVVGVHSVNPKRWTDYSYRLIFDPETKHFIELLPAIQICFYEKSCMELKGFDIIYPEKYVAA